MHVAAISIAVLLTTSCAAQRAARAPTLQLHLNQVAELHGDRVDHRRLVARLGEDASAGHGQALNVERAPETGGIMITKFNATLTKDSGVVKARCKSKKTPFLREVTYKDGTSETATLVDKCKRKQPKN